MVAIALICWLRISKPREEAAVTMEIAAAQDAVYEAVVSDMTTPAHRQQKITQLVFNNELLTSFEDGPGGESCEKVAKQNLGAGTSMPPLNSLVDKVYRLVTRGGDDYSIRPDTILDFAQKDCAGGHLSETFHTDLPRTFISPGSVSFNLAPTRENRNKSFEQLFPGADGIISFSHVGFDTSLDEAIVSTSFVCGLLCGSGHIYVLQKRYGRWKVVNAWMIWIS